MSTTKPYQVVVCSYTGVHFIKMVQMSGGVQLELQDLSYETDQFVNRVIEYDIDKFLGVAWENNKFIFIDHQKE